MTPHQKSASASPATRRVRRFLFRRRRLLAALLFCAAAGLAVNQLIPVRSDVANAAIAAEDLPAGMILSGEQITTARLPTDGIPAGAFRDPKQLIGQQLATPLQSGSVIAPTSLVGPGLLTGTAPGTVAVPIRPTDPSTLELLAPGQLVDVVLSTGNGYEIDTANTILASNVAVLWTSDTGPAGGPWPAAGTQTGGLVVVAATPEQSTALAGASSSGKVHLVLTSGRAK